MSNSDMDKLVSSLNKAITKAGGGVNNRIIAEALKSSQWHLRFPYGWRSIETAPKDGTHILVAPTGKPLQCGVHGQELPPVCEAFWQDSWYNQQISGWQLANCDEEYGCLFEATHWMPLPEPPALEGKND